MEKSSKTYKHLIELGFKRKGAHDTVFFDTYGYHYFWLQYKLADKWLITWTPTNQSFELYHRDGLIQSGIHDYNKIFLLIQKDKDEKALRKSFKRRNK